MRELKQNVRKGTPHRSGAPFRACVFLIGIDNAAAVCLTDNPAIICVITMSGTLFWID
jgi:hypothetical protein